MLTTVPCINTSLDLGCPDLTTACLSYHQQSCLTAVFQSIVCTLKFAVLVLSSLQSSQVIPHLTNTTDVFAILLAMFHASLYNEVFREEVHTQFTCL